MTATLYAIPASHPCAAVEAALRLKGLDYRRVDLLPLAAKAQQWARFRGTTVPGLQLDGGERILGSRSILRRLEHLAPEPQLLPLDARERRAVEEAERWGDEVLQPLARRLVWAALVRAPGALMSYTEGARLPVPRPLARVTAPLVARGAARANGADDGEVRADLINLDLHMDRAGHWIDIGAMGGETPNAADLQVGASMALLLTLEDVAPRVKDRTCAEVARRWFRDYPGRVPAGTFPPAWLSARAP